MRENVLMTNNTNRRKMSLHTTGWTVEQLSYVSSLQNGKANCMLDILPL